MNFPLLDTIQLPSDLREHAVGELPEICAELREYLIQTVSQSGGHLASGLGVIELTVALHYVFNTPDDRLVWDVGHQCYPHKILTGRKEQMGSIRKDKGLAGFPKRGESEYDTFGVGHSSTSISAALGMAIAAEKTGSSRQSVAIIGDGAMTAGMAFEALNHASDTGSNLLVILNDNEMSISPNVGGLSNYLTKILSGKVYNQVRSNGKRVLNLLPPIEEFARRAEDHLKGMVTPGTLFEELGFEYYGPIDGHDSVGLAQTLQNLKSINKPKLLHIVTKKGKGYALAEAEPILYHGVSQFDPKIGLTKKKPSKPVKSYSQIFGDWLCDQAKTDKRLVGITPAMREGSGMVEFSEKFPDRYFDVGIAEQHSVTLAAGMACDGLKPVVAIYSTFLQRAYDQVIHDVVLQNLPVLFGVDRAGIVGADGPTHSGSFDIAYLRCLPNIVIMTPSDENECRLMLNTGFAHDGPAAVRYPRGNGPGNLPAHNDETIEIGKAKVIREGSKLAILVFGTMIHDIISIADKYDATLVDMRFVKPLDAEKITDIVDTHSHVVTLEEGCRAGGAGSAVNEYILNNLEKCPKLLNIGLDDDFPEHGSREFVLSVAGIDPSGIEQKIHSFLNP